MNLSVRPMKLEETDFVVGYFHGASSEFLDDLGIDPSRLPHEQAWKDIHKRDYELVPKDRPRFFVMWFLDNDPIGFSSCDKIIPGEEAYMHLHMVRSDMRKKGVGTECVLRTVDIYFEVFDLKKIFCQPNALNVAPNRTLQKTGFRYVKTYVTVPGWINYRHAVTQWVLER